MLSARDWREAVAAIDGPLDPAALLLGAANRAENDISDVGCVDLEALSGAEDGFSAIFRKFPTLGELGRVFIRGAATRDSSARSELRCAAGFAAAEKEDGLEEDIGELWS
jgi:hypothetical protein